MTRNLIPAPITDKNGKLTTVHKKQQPSSSSNSPLPAPSLTVKRDLSEVRRVLEARLQEPCNEHHGYEVDFSGELQQYSERTLNNIELATRNDDKLARSVIKDILDGEEHALIGATIHYYWKSGSTDYWRTALDVRTIINYAPLQMHRDLGNVDEHTEKQCLALMKFTQLVDTMPDTPSPFINYVPYDDSEMRFIMDESLIALIADRPEDVDRIAEIALKHGTSDAAAIHGILEGAFPPVAEGYL